VLFRDLNTLAIDAYMLP